MREKTFLYYHKNAIDFITCRVNILFFARVNVHACVNDNNRVQFMLRTHLLLVQCSVENQLINVGLGYDCGFFKHVCHIFIC